MQPRVGRSRCGRAVFAIAGVLVALLVWGGDARGLIDPKFTPVDLVKGAQTIAAGRLVASGADEWKLEAPEAIKGDVLPPTVLSLAAFDKGQVEDVRKMLAQNGAAPVLLLVGGRDGEKRGFLHVAGTWLAAKPAAGGRWDVSAFDMKMTGVYAGGTDTLIRMARYIVADPAASVPASVGAAWTKEKCRLGKVGGEVVGMQAIEVKGDRRMYLFVASDAGDRLFRAKANDEAFEDVTVAARLETRSRQFTWMDLDGDGQVDLVSWDGAAITIGLLGKDGTVKALPGPPFRPAGECLGLAAASAPSSGDPAVLVSTRGMPLLVSRDAQGEWRMTTLPAADATGAAPMACIVADLDNDGFFDVLQPREKGGLLWRGRSGGFAAPVASPVRWPGAWGRWALGDFNQDGLLDVFLVGPAGHELWENDGRGSFRAVSQWAGSLSYKVGTGLSGCCVADLNHDGRQDLALLYARDGFTYHFNRGFRCFGAEGGLSLGEGDGVAESASGQKACAVADFNGDGSLDLAVALANGEIYCFYNDACNKPLVRVGAKGVGGPVTVSLWQGAKFPVCLGAAPMHPRGPRVGFCLRDATDYTVRWRPAGGPERTRTLHVPEKLPEGGLEVVLDP